MRPPPKDGVGYKGETNQFGHLFDRTSSQRTELPHVIFLGEHVLSQIQQPYSQQPLTCMGQDDPTRMESNPDAAEYLFFSTGNSVYSIKIAQVLGEFRFNRRHRQQGREF